MIPDPHRTIAAQLGTLAHCLDACGLPLYAIRTEFFRTEEQRQLWRERRLDGHHRLEGEMNVPQRIEAADLAPIDPMIAMIERVVLNPEADLAKLERMLDMRERLEERAARKAFDLAMSAAKAAIPPITKNRLVSHEMKTGGMKSYRHEDLAGIAHVVDPSLAEHGLSYRYRTKQEADRLTVTCIVSHRDGHSEETTLSGPLDPSGGKNAHQAIGSAVTYLQRYTLKAALGLAVSADDDARSTAAAETISEDNFRDLRALLEQSSTLEEPFLKHFGIEHLHEMPASRAQEANWMLRAKIAQRQASGN